MPVVQIADIAFGYGATSLFENVTFHVNVGERAALVAPNGAGKSTLLRVIVGELASDHGSVVIEKGASVGFYRQSHELSDEGTVLDALLSGFENIVQLRKQLAHAREQAADGTHASLQALASVEEKYQLAHGDELERRLEMLVQRLGFHAGALSRPVASLSGGERGRLNLGVVLAHEHDLLLLDEPTNHLDLQTIRWLEQYLLRYRGAVIVVSHDRAFLDNVCPRTVELGMRGVRDYPLPYTRYAVEREKDLERERAAVDRQKALVSKTEDFIRKNLAGQKTKQAQSRRRMLEKMDVLDTPEDVWAIAKRVAFRFAPAPRTGDIVLDATGLGAARGGRTLFQGVNLLLRRGERLGIVGPNGCGKTTLLRILAGHPGTDDRGQVRRGSNLLDGYFDQHLGTLDDEHTGVEEIRSVRGEMNEDVTRGYLARFRFWGDQPFQKVASMSGGERSRLALAKLLLEPRNVLFLDEPTNHLDIPAAEVLEEALRHYDGTTVFVSHDRRFLENISTRLLVFGEDGVDLFPGSFGDWVDGKKGVEQRDASEEDISASGGKRRGKRREPAPKVPRSEGRAAFEANKAVVRALQKKRRRFEQLEKLISDGEQQVEQVKQRAELVPGDDWEKLSKLTEEQKALEDQVEQWMEEWSALGEELDP